MFRPRCGGVVRRSMICAPVPEGDESFVALGFSVRGAPGAAAVCCINPSSLRGSDMRINTRARAIASTCLVLLLAIGTSTEAEAQGSVITGKVTGAGGEALVGANVYINDLQLSQPTNAQGMYTLSIPSARCCGQLVNLRVRALGYRPEARPIRVAAGTTTINFTLLQDANRLDEIVVTGSLEGTERAKVPFAVARLSAEDMPVPAFDPLKALGGKVAGVRIASAGGRPGTAPEIMLRGPTSINGSGRGQGPLIIVDGAIMNNVGSLEELGGLDIESVEVVKGAAGASLYGTRAANGVITIKTRRGATGQEGIKFNVRSEFGVTDVNSIEYGQAANHHLQLDETGKRFCVQGSINLSSCSRTFDWMTEIMRINSVPGDTTRAPQIAQWNAPSASGGQLQNVYQSQIWPGQYYDTFAQLVSMNPVMLNQVDATGRVGGVRVYISGARTDERGAIRGLNGIQQTRGRVNLDYDVRSDLLISVSSMYDHANRDLREPGAGFFTLLVGAPAGTDNTRRDSLGRYIRRGGGAGLRGSGNGTSSFFYNTDNNNEWDERSSDRFLGNVAANYFPAEWVTIEGTLAYDNRNRQDQHWFVKGYRTVTPSTSLNNGQIQINNRLDRSYNGSLTATLRRQLSTDLSGKMSFRGLIDESTFQASDGYGEIFLVKDIFDLDNASQNFDIGSAKETIKNTGLLAGASLDYKGKYIFDGTFRRDGSSLFGEGNRYANFNRVSAVWRVSEEGFWNLNQVRDFRLRGSRGTAGSTPRFSAQYETYNVTTAGISLGQAGNSKLRPETTTEYEFGTDFTLFNRLGVEVTHARGRTVDQILEVNTPASLGFSTQWQNAGTLENKTWELGLNLPILNRRDLQWSMRGTWDRTRTVISELFTTDYAFSPAGGTFFRITASETYCRDPFQAAPPATGSPNRRLGDCAPFVGTDGQTYNPISVTNGHQANRFGAIWGRKFYRTCGDLPTSVQPLCGDGKDYQVNDQGYVVWVGAGNTWRDGITKNLWQAILPGTASPWGNSVPLYWGMPIVDRPLRGQPGEGVGVQQILGNVFPDFRFGWSNTITYRRLNAYALLEGTIGHEIYNRGEQWGLFDFSSGAFDQTKRTVETAKPVGYGWRTGPSEGAGIGGFYDILNANNYNVESGSYAKLREVSLTYSIGPVRGIGDWKVGFVGRNILTITNYTGYDPETGAPGSQTGSGLINQADDFNFPTFRTFNLFFTSRF